MKNAKYFVLDTNVLLHNPQSIFSFGKNYVILPIDVIEELDKFKKHHDEKGRNARTVIRALDNLRHKGNLGDGIQMDNGGIIKIVSIFDISDKKFKNFDLVKVDNRIILFIEKLQEKEKDREIYFVSKDIHARIKADALGIKSADFEKEKVNIDDLYTGITEMFVPKEIIDTLYAEHKIKLSTKDVFTNQYIILKDETNPSHTALARYCGISGMCLLVNNMLANVWGIKPRNFEQKIALDLLCDDTISLVSLVGTAGTGKTLLALAAGLRKTLDEEHYQRILVSRPIIPFGQDIGFLPGTKTQKIENWMQPIFDNLEYIIDGCKRAENKKVMNIEYLLSANFLELEPLTYMRGRSIPKQYIIIDEAQNLTPHELKTIITRAGEGTKMILTGDPYQIDSPYLDASSNGLTYVVERLKGIKEFGHIVLRKSERSALASIAAQKL